MVVLNKTRPAPAAWLRQRNTVALWIVAGSAAVFTGLIRLIGLGSSTDVWVDEVYYWRIGHSVESGGFPRYRGGLFFLHPPGFFYLEGAWERVFGRRLDVISGVYEMRLLNTLLAALSAAVLALLIVRVTRSTWAALAAAAVFALDPFVLRITQRALIETSMTLWVLLGYLVLLPSEQEHPSGLSRRRAAAGGLLFGLAILTKDVAALITVLPLLAAVVLGRPFRRSRSLLATAVAAAPYMLYVGIVTMAGHWALFSRVKTVGIKRLLGEIQATGFNAQGAPSLSRRLVDELSQFGTTYVLLALGPLAVVPLLRRREPAQRLLVLWYLSAGLALLYAVVKGTLEETALYLLLVPTIVVVTTTAVMLCEQRQKGERRVQIIRAGTLCLLALALALSGATYVSDRVHPDDGYTRLRHYMVEHVPAGSPVISPSSSVDLVLNDRYHIGRWFKPPDRARAHVAYVVVPWRLVEQGYTDFTTRQARSLTQQGKRVFAFHGRTYGTVAVYRLPIPPLPTTARHAGAGGD